MFVAFMEIKLSSDVEAFVNWIWERCYKYAIYLNKFTWVLRSGVSSIKFKTIQVIAYQLLQWIK